MRGGVDEEEWLEMEEEAEELVALHCPLALDRRMSKSQDMSTMWGCHACCIESTRPSVLVVC